MTDRWQGTGQFHPAKAWRKITGANKARAFDAKNPLSWWDRFWIPTSVAALLLAIIGCALYLLGWGLGAPYA